MIFNKNISSKNKKLETTFAHNKLMSGLALFIKGNKDLLVIKQLVFIASTCWKKINIR